MTAVWMHGTTCSLRWNMISLSLRLRLFFFFFVFFWYLFSTSNYCISAGYNYYGTERMYSGTDGREFEADIFFGVVYYQRLRHMVADKYQVPFLPFQWIWSSLVFDADIFFVVLYASEWWHHIMRVIWLALRVVSRDHTSVLLAVIHWLFLFSSQFDKTIFLTLVSCCLHKPMVLSKRAVTPG